MSWWSVVLPITVAVAICFLPGAAVGATLGLRRLMLWGFAPAFSFSVVAIAAVANQVVPFRWGIVPVLVVTALIAAISFLLSLTWRRSSSGSDDRRLSRRALVAILAGLSVAVLSIGLRLKLIFGSPDHIAQRFDNIFHLNAVRWILENQNASPFKMATLTFDIDGQTSFYPNLWHAFNALVADTTGIAIPAAVNSSSIAIAAVVWPLACVVLARQVIGPRPVALFAAGALSSVFTAFPYLMLDFGVLYPTFLAISLLPIALAGLLIALRQHGAEGSGAAARWLVVVGVLPGLVLAHPTIVISLLVVTIPVGVSFAVRHVRALRDRGASTAQYLPAIALGLVWVGGLAVVFIAARPSTVALRFPVESLRQAAQGAVTNGTVFRPPDYILSLVAVVGVVLCIRHRRALWLVIAWALSVGLYVVAASFPLGPLRTAITGFWYDDPYRLAAVLPVLVLPLVVMGITGAVDALEARGAGSEAPSLTYAGKGRREAAIIGPVLIVLVVISSQSGAALLVQTQSAQEAYALTGNSPLLTEDELALLERMDEEVPEGTTVAGNPSTGTSLVYALTGRRALLPHIFGVRDAETNLLIRSLRDADEDPNVCRSADDLQVSYALEFDGKDVDGLNRDGDFPGLENLATSDAVELVDSEGRAQLYRLIACD